MNRDDVNWQRLLARLPHPVHRRAGGCRRRGAARAARVVPRRGAARHLRQRHDGRVVLAVAGRAAARRGDRDRPGRRPGARRDRLHVATRRARRSSSASHAIGGRRRGHRLDAAALLEDVPRRDRAVLPGHLGRGRRPADGLQLAARRRASTSGPTSRAASPTSTTSSRSRTRTPNLEQFSETTQAGRRPGPRVRSVHGRRRARAPARVGRRRLHRRRLALGPPATREFWEASGAATSSPHARTPSRRTSSSRSSGCRAAGAGQFGAYQSQLKVLMGLLGQPIGDVRPPRLPVTDDGEHRADAGDPRRGRAGGAGGGGRVSVFQGVDHVGVGVGDVDEAIDFYGRHVGFDRVLFDVTAELPARRGVRRPGAARAGRDARVERRHPDRAGTGEARPGARRRRAAARPGGPGLGRGRACARSASTSAASPRCTPRSSPPAAPTLMPPMTRRRCRRPGSRSTSRTSPTPGARSSR